MDQITSWFLTNLLLASAIAVAFLVAVVSFLVAAKWRRTLSEVLSSGDSAPPLGLFDLSRGDATGQFVKLRLVEPERLWTYDDHYLATFVKVYALNHDQSFAGDGHRSLETVYRSKILRQWDLAFAVGLATFAFLVDLTLANAVQAIPVVWHVLVLAAGMAIVYGAADVAEDLKLAAILNHPKMIDAGQTAAANALTRVKIVAITFSLTGIVLFTVLSAIAKALDRSGGTTPTPTPSPELAL